MTEKGYLLIEGLFGIGRQQMLKGKTGIKELSDVE